jgi:hypothetical protein
MFPCRLSAVALMAAIVTPSCGASSIREQTNEEVGEIRSETKSLVVNTRCEDPNAYASSCGMMMKRLATPEFLADFRENHCRDLTEEKCDDRYNRMIAARLSQRYPLAEYQRIQQSCDANPGQCDDLVAYEQLLLYSHNAQVRRQGAMKELDAQERGRQALEQDARETLRTVDAAPPPSP